MIVTDIQELSKSRSKIVLDQEFAFVLYKGELRQYSIKLGQEFSEEAYREIMTEVLPKRAKLRAMNLLKSRTYTTAQLRIKLQQGGYPETVIGEALEYVASFHYTDDLRYAVDFITDNEHRKSRFRIEQDLRGKGIPAEVIEQAWQKWQANGGTQDEDAMIEALLRKKNYDSERADIKEQQKVYAFLMRKGFSGEKISRAMRKDF